MSEIVTVFDHQEWDKFFNKLGGNLRKATNFLKVIASTVGYKDIIDHFDKESGPQEKWQERLPKTQARYDAIGGTYRSSNKILQLTGRLRQSVNPGSGGVKTVGVNAIKMYTGVTYARTHDEGDSTRNIPKREFMWLSPPSKQEMVNTLMKMILEKSE